MTVFLELVDILEQVFAVFIGFAPSLHELLFFLHDPFFDLLDFLVVGSLRDLTFLEICSELLFSFTALNVDLALYFMENLVLLHFLLVLLPVTHAHI